LTIIVERRRNTGRSRRQEKLERHSEAQLERIRNNYLRDAGKIGCKRHRKRDVQLVITRSFWSSGGR
jgi:hypothetical protein